MLHSRHEAHRALAKDRSREKKTKPEKCLSSSEASASGEKLEYLKSEVAQVKCLHGTNEVAYNDKCLPVVCTQQSPWPVPASYVLSANRSWGKGGGLSQCDGQMVRL